MTDVFLVNDSRGQNNWGCRATTTALIDLIERSDRVIGSISHAPHTDFAGRGELKLLARSIVRSAPFAHRAARTASSRLNAWRGPKAGFITSFDDFQSAADAVDQGKLWANEGKLLRTADVTIVNGEGAIYGRQLKGFITLFWAWYAKTRHNKRAAIVNHTADLSDPNLRRAAENVYPLLDDVSFREPVSLRECGYAAPQAQSGVVPDAAFCHQALSMDAIREWAKRPGFFSIWPFDAEGFDITQPYLAVTGSSALNRPETTGGKSASAGFADLCLALGRLGLPVILVAPDPTDAELLGPVARALKLPFIAPSTPLPIAHQVLAHASCLIGGRWHPGILAATGGTPLVNLTANTKKTTALLEQLDLETTTFDCGDLKSGIGDISELVAVYLAQGDGLRSRIRARADMLRAQSFANIRVLHTPPTSQIVSEAMV
jgi:hypothetical protein